MKNYNCKYCSQCFSNKNDTDNHEKDLFSRSAELGEGNNGIQISMLDAVPTLS